jgi:hypothetical protein
VARRSLISRGCMIAALFSLASAGSFAVPSAAAEPAGVEEDTPMATSGSFSEAEEGYTVSGETDIEEDTSGLPTDLVGWRVYHYGGNQAGLTWSSPVLDASDSYNRDANNFKQSQVDVRDGEWTCSAHLGPTRYKPQRNRLQASAWMACNGAVERYFFRAQFIRSGPIWGWFQYSNARDTPRCSKEYCVWVLSVACNSGYLLRHYYAVEGRAYVRLRNDDLVHSPVHTGSKTLDRKDCGPSAA